MDDNQTARRRKPIRWWHWLIGVAFLVGLLWVLAVMDGLYDDDQISAQPPPTRAAKSTPKDPTDKQCLRDASCAAKRSAWKTDGFPKCFRHIEDQALYDYDWTAGVNSRFNAVELVSSYDHVKYIGSQARFRNAFNAWQRVKYVCAYDPINKAVISVEIQPYQ